MGLKTKIGMAMATSAAGAAMVVGGSFALFSAGAQTTGDTFTSGTVKITAPTNGWTAGPSATFSNMAPGDTVTDSFQIQNTGSLAEWVVLETTPNNVATPAQNGAPANLNGLFYSYDSSSVDSALGNALGNPHGTSDQALGGSNGTSQIYGADDFQTDKHPAQYKYDVVVDGQHVASSLYRSDVDWHDAYNHPFMLLPGHTATVTYSVYLPLAAHNDYQNAAGNLSVELDAVQVKNNWYDKSVSGGQRQDGMPSDANPAPQTPWPFSWQPEPNNN